MQQHNHHMSPARSSCRGAGRRGEATGVNCAAAACISAARDDVIAPRGAHPSALLARVPACAACAGRRTGPAGPTIEMLLGARLLCRHMFVVCVAVEGRCRKQRVLHGNHCLGERRDMATHARTGAAPEHAPQHALLRVRAVLLPCAYQRHVAGPQERGQQLRLREAHRRHKEGLRLPRQPDRLVEQHRRARQRKRDPLRASAQQPHRRGTCVVQITTNTSTYAPCRRANGVGPMRRNTTTAEASPAPTCASVNATVTPTTGLCHVPSSRSQNL